MCYTCSPTCLDIYAVLHAWHITDSYNFAFTNCCTRTDLCDGSGCADGCNGWWTLMWGGVGWLLGWCTPRLGGVPDIGCARPPCNDWGDGVIRELQRQKNALLLLRSRKIFPQPRESLVMRATGRKGSIYSMAKVSCSPWVLVKVMS